MGALSATKTAAPKTTAPAKAAAPATTARPQAAKQQASSFDDAKPRGARNYLTPLDDYTAAVYTVKVNRLQLILAQESKAPQKCESSIIELEVVESNNPKCPAGFVGSVVYTNRHYQEIYWSNVKGFLCALLGLEPEDIKTKTWHAAFGRFDLIEFESAEEEAETKEEISKLVTGALVNVTVKYKLREGKKPITQEIWTPNETQHPSA
jgi:hypothetical protein